MKRELKSFAAGAITTALVAGIMMPAFGASVGKTITAFYNGIKIYVDGELIEPKDGNGKKVDPFIYDGTTYLPVRAVSEALGKTVNWDSNTNSVYIGKVKEQSTKEVTVGTAEEFVKAIAPNTKIILKPGVYDLSSIKDKTNSKDGMIVWEDILDGKELNINNIWNLTIEGMEPGKVEIITEPRYAHIMYFKNANNVTIKNIVAGHTPKEYECDAGVLKFDGSSSIVISSSRLYGCGSIGVDLYDSENVVVSDCEITECSLRAVDINNSKHVEFKSCKFNNHKAYSNIIDLFNSEDIKFTECKIIDNKDFYWSLLQAEKSTSILFDKCLVQNNSKSEDELYKECKTYFFDTKNSDILFKDSTISDNACDYFFSNESEVKFDNCTVEKNAFQAVKSE